MTTSSESLGGGSEAEAKAAALDDRRVAATKAAMGLARRVAESNLDADLLALVESGITGVDETITRGSAAGSSESIRELITSTVGLVWGPPEPGVCHEPHAELWDLQQRITRDVLAAGGLTDDELHEALVRREGVVGQWSNIDDALPAAPQIDSVAPQDSSASGEPARGARGPPASS